MTTIYTVGYAHWSALGLQTRIEAMDAMLFDIRYSPYSRRADFNGDALEARFGDRYYHLMSWGNDRYRVGPPIRIHNFQSGLAIVRDVMRRRPGHPVVLLCGCADYEMCHRAVIADLLRAVGYTVEELLSGSDVPMRALTLWQPWASLVAWGEKRIETRSWSTTYRGPLIIHAAKTFPVEAREVAFIEPFRSVLVAHGVTALRDLPLGAFVAVTELDDCKRITPDHAATLSEQERAFGDYTPNRVAWELSDIRLLTTPILARGAMGLWTPDGDTVALLTAQERAA